MRNYLASFLQGDDDEDDEEEDASDVVIMRGVRFAAEDFVQLVRRNRLVHAFFLLRH